MRHDRRLGWLGRGRGDSVLAPLALFGPLATAAIACGEGGGARDSAIDPTLTSGPSSMGGSADDGDGDDDGSDASGSSEAGDTTTPTDDTGAEPTVLEWPNAESFANSDPWLAEHHDEIERMRPRILALNYVNARSMEEMTAQLQGMIDVLAESSRFHGYADPDAPAFLQYELAYAVDLRDATPPAGWAYRNSTLYPREDPIEGYWSFDYEALFSEEYAAHLGIEDPAAPGTNLRLCEAIDRGLVHEIWIYGDGDVPDVSAAEILELKPRYDESFQRIEGSMNRCAGNGCFDDEDTIPCVRTVRVAWFNNTRGPGCFLESLSHGLEWTGAETSDVLPYLSRYFPEITGMQLDERHGLPISSWYDCPYGVPCLQYPSETSVTYDVSAEVQGTIEGYDPVCGNVHWAPNATQHYDLQSTASVRSSCTHWRDGSGTLETYDGSAHEAYAALAPDCMGGFLVWWRQNLPGLHNAALDDTGAPMKNWWPFLYY
jgi:hypothetical protein